jgi:4-amino-4-deoxy-L-arabinose transferase-like glycosyltransferase
MKKILNIIIFITSVTAVFFILHLNEYIQLRPQSIHIWRQTDCLSITQNYYQNGNSFWVPEIHNQLSDDGQSGLSAGEFPALYYVVSLLWKVFGKHEWLYRAFVFLCFVFGCWSVFKLSLEITKNYLLSVFLSLLLFASPTIANYSINFLPNVPALGLVMISWLFIFYFHNLKKDIYLWLSMLLFALAILLKVTAGLSFVALLGWWFIETLFVKKRDKLFPNGIKNLWPFIMAIGLTFSWYLYANYFNGIHQGKYTFNSLWPIWEMSKEKISETLDAVNKIWLVEYFYPKFLILTVGVWAFMLCQPKKIKPFFYYLLIIIPIGCVIYLLFWFQALSAHDYYLINIIFVVLLIWAIFVFSFHKHRWLNRYASIALLGCLIFLIFTCKSRIENRYNPCSWMNDKYTSKFDALSELEPKLDNLGIKPSDKVISIPDYTINATLYYLNRKGYCNYGSDFSTAESFEKRIKQGAKFLIVNDSTLLKKECIKPYTQNEIIRYKNVSIFDLR